MIHDDVCVARELVEGRTPGPPLAHFWCDWDVDPHDGVVLTQKCVACGVVRPPRTPRIRTRPDKRHYD